jgi:Nuclease-related domain
MQKVEGSSPFSRSQESPAHAGFFHVRAPPRYGRRTPGSSPGSRSRGAGPEEAQSSANPEGGGVREQWDHRSYASADKTDPDEPSVQSVLVMRSFPRRQQYRRLRRAAARASAGLVACLFAVIVAGADVWAAAGAFLLVAVGFLVDARRWVRLAARSRVGARSEEEVRRALAALVAEGWRLRHSLAYGGRSDIDSVAIAPTGIAFAIETKCAARRPVVSRFSREELEVRFLGPMAYPDPKGERDNSMPMKRWSAEASGLGCRGTRVIWRKPDCLHPNLQTMQRSVCRKDACDRHHTLRQFFSSAVATFGVWGVAQ